jgi:hypothetical protein
MDKDQIIREIQLAAKANGGIALGWRRFEEKTGIRYYDWCGQFWSRWSDAIREAGCEPNRMSESYDEKVLIECLILLTRRMGHTPTVGELLLATNNDKKLPSAKVFRRLGKKPERISKVIAFCEANPGHDDVLALWRETAKSQKLPAVESAHESASSKIGYVYLLKHGSRQEFKIGRTNSPIRREGEIRTQLPEKLEPVHYIKTDDPAGIEKYWHDRFANKRKEGEWFALTSQDVAAFKRWKRIC